MEAGPKERKEKEKKDLEQDPCFLDQTKMIPVLDGFTEVSSIVDDVVGLQDCLRVRIWIVFNFSVLEKVFNLIENIIKWGDWVIVHFYHLIFEILDLDW